MQILIHGTHSAGIWFVTLNIVHYSFCICSNSHEDQLSQELSWPWPECKCVGKRFKISYCEPFSAIKTKFISRASAAINRTQIIPAMNHRLHWEETEGFLCWQSNSRGRSTEKIKDAQSKSLVCNPWDVRRSYLFKSWIYWDNNEGKGSPKLGRGG